MLYICAELKQQAYMKANVTAAPQPMIVKFNEPSRGGIQSLLLSRHAIGFVLQGRKQIYQGDKRYSIERGEVYFLDAGRHYVENTAAEGKPYEEIVFYYTPLELQHTLQSLNMTYGMQIDNDHSCERCRNNDFVSQPAWSALRSFFGGTNNYLRDDVFMRDETAERLKMTELIYLIISQRECCLKSKVLNNIDSARDSFRRVVQQYIFNDVSIETLASLTNRSLTSFKKDFRRMFNMPPHKWFIRQRLMQARLLLISTSKSVSEIGSECAFVNPSHFIKLFKRAYGFTPATYRGKYVVLNAQPAQQQEHNAAAM